MKAKLKVFAPLDFRTCADMPVQITDLENNSVACVWLKTMNEARFLSLQSVTGQGESPRQLVPPLRSRIPDTLYCEPASYSLEDARFNKVAEAILFERRILRF